MQTTCQKEKKWQVSIYECFTQEHCWHHYVALEWKWQLISQIIMDDFYLTFGAKDWCLATPWSLLGYLDYL